MLQSSLLAVLAGIVAAWLIERRASRSVIPMLVALAIPGAAVLAVLAGLGALPAFFTDTVVYTFQTFGASQALPFPWQPALLHDTSFWEASIGALWAIPMHWLLAVVAPVVLALYTALAMWRHRRTLADLPDWTLIGLVAVGLFASVLIVHMSDQNFWLSSGLTLPLVAMPVRGILAGMRSGRLVAGAAIIPLAFIYLAGLSPLVLGYALVCHTDGTGFLREVATAKGSICTTYDSAPIVAGAADLHLATPGDDRLHAQRPFSLPSDRPCASGARDVPGARCHATGRARSGRTVHAGPTCLVGGLLQHRLQQGPAGGQTAAERFAFAL